MKILICAIVTIFSLTSFQTKKTKPKNTVVFCDKDGNSCNSSLDTLFVKNIEECRFFKTVSGREVFGYTLGFLSEGKFTEVMVSGNGFSSEIINALKSERLDIKKLIISDVSVKTKEGKFITIASESSFIIMH